jgi:hypothetical protein
MITVASKFSYHTHSLQNGGHPQLWARLPKSVHNPIGWGWGYEGEETKRRPAALLIAFGGWLEGGGGEEEKGRSKVSLY